jgi:ABC-type branched-subunit amino acid transport system substrate-binding protein
VLPLNRRTFRQFRIIIGLWILTIFLSSFVFAADGKEDLKYKPGKSAGKSDIILLMAFDWADDPAALELERGFFFALRRVVDSSNVAIIKVESPIECAQACDSLMVPSGPHLIVFAGDDGAAAVVALKSAASHTPILKLTSDAQSVSKLSSSVFEFLPSAAAQGDILGKFAVRNLNVTAAMLLSERDLRGHAAVAGFRHGFAAAGGSIEAARDYAPDASSVRGELTDLFSSQSRLSHGGKPLNEALSSSERTEAFGDSMRGEVLFDQSKADSDTVDSVAVNREGLFFALSTEKLELFSSQLPTVPEGTILLGNSGWINLETLKRHQNALDGMYMVAPLLSQGTDSNSVLSAYMQETKADAGAWELLGLDVGAFVGHLMASAPRNRADVAKALLNAPHFTGAAVIVDFDGSQENKSARILRFEDGVLRVLR